VALRSDLPEFWNNRGFCRDRKGDPRGALEDYAKGLELCRAQGLIRSTQEHSVAAFLARMASVHDALGAAARATGDAEGARKATEEAARLRSEAAALAVPASTAPPATRP
jgi:tetratricopeptide (TPR) repeat protein